MNVWLIQDGEPLPEIDAGTRPLRTAMLADSLCRQGHQVWWWASTFDHAKKKHRFDYPCTIELSSGVKIILLHGAGYASNRTPRRILHQRQIAQSFARECVEHPAPDIIVCSVPLPELAEQAIIYGRKYNVPVVIDVRDMWPDIYLTMFPRPLRPIVRMVLNSEFRRIQRVLRSASAIVAVSDTYLQGALRYAGRSMRDSDGVFPLGYQKQRIIGEKIDRNELFSQYGIRPDCMLVTFVGTFGFSYDLETVAQAARVIETSCEHPTQIVLIGDGDAGPRIRKLAQGASSLVLTGWLDNESIQTILDSSSVSLAAYSPNATQTLPNKPFEYMAAGVPILSSLTGELEEMIRREKIGLQYKAGDVDSLVEKIHWFAANPTECQEMGQRACKLFEERFAANTIYQSMTEHIERLAQLKSQ